METGLRIACPKCEWEPDGGQYWQCTCNHTWNTFETAGQCPACGKRWKDTQCPVCSKWSPHPDWYRDLDSLLEEELREAVLETEHDKPTQR